MLALGLFFYCIIMALSWVGLSGGQGSEGTIRGGWDRMLSGNQYYRVFKFIEFLSHASCVSLLKIEPSPLI